LDPTTYIHKIIYFYLAYIKLSIVNMVLVAVLLLGRFQFSSE
jgi:hypothetical protein